MIRTHALHLHVEPTLNVKNKIMLGLVAVCLDTLEIHMKVVGLSVLLIQIAHRAKLVFSINVKTHAQELVD